MDLLDGSFEIVSFMNKCFVIAAWLLHLAMAWREISFHFAIICFGKDRYVLNLAHTNMKANDEAG
jgi:hypothetical protein